MTDDGDVPATVLTALRAVCLGLPDTYEEAAWTGQRWRVRKKTFAHVLVVDDERPSGISEAMGVDEPTVLLTFRAPAAEIEVLSQVGHPFFHLGWGRDAMGMVIDDDVDWDEVAELVTDSYCVMAPKMLAARVDRPALESDET